jgi:hypothetical protein
VTCRAIGILPIWIATTAFSSSKASRGAGSHWESCISWWYSHINKSTVHQFNFCNNSLSFPLLKLLLN